MTTEIGGIRVPEASDGNNWSQHLQDVATDVSSTYLADDLLGSIHVDRYAVGDANSARGTITSGSATLTIGTSEFTADDVGKIIHVKGAGASGAVLDTTIATYVSGTEVTLATTASTSVVAARCVWGTDDTDAFQDAVDDATTAGRHMLWMGDKNYLIVGTVTTTVPLTICGVFRGFAHIHAADLSTGGTAFVAGLTSNQPLFHHGRTAFGLDPTAGGSVQSAQFRDVLFYGGEADRPCLSWARLNGENVMQRVTIAGFLRQALYTDQLFDAVFDAVNIFQCGANGTSARDGAMTAASETLTSVGATFTADDVGAPIYVHGAAANGGILATTIAAYVSATEVTLADAAVTTVASATYAYDAYAAVHFNASSDQTNSVHMFGVRIEQCPWAFYGEALRTTQIVASKIHVAHEPHGEFVMPQVYLGPGCHTVTFAAIHARGYNIDDSAYSSVAHVPYFFWFDCPDAIITPGSQLVATAAKGSRWIKHTGANPGKITGSTIHACGETPFDVGTRFDVKDNTIHWALTGGKGALVNMVAACRVEDNDVRIPAAAAGTMTSGNVFYVNGVDNAIKRNRFEHVLSTVLGASTTAARERTYWEPYDPRNASLPSGTTPSVGMTAANPMGQHKFTCANASQTIDTLTQGYNGMQILLWANNSTTTVNHATTGTDTITLKGGVTKVLAQFETVRLTRVGGRWYET